MLKTKFSQKTIWSTVCCPSLNHSDLWTNLNLWLSKKGKKLFSKLNFHITRRSRGFEVVVAAWLAAITKLSLLVWEGLLSLRVRLFSWKSIWKLLVEWKQTVWDDFFDIKLLVQPDVVFDSDSNDRNFSSLAPPGGEKKNIFNFFTK